MENLGFGSGAREGGEGSERVNTNSDENSHFNSHIACRVGALAVITASGRWDVLAAKDVWPCLCLYVLYKQYHKSTVLVPALAEQL